LPTGEELGKRKERCLKAKEVYFNLPANERIIVPFNRFGQAYGEASGLLAGVIGILGTNLETFPISYHSWDKIPEFNKESCFRDLKVTTFFLMFCFTCFSCLICGMVK